MSHRRSTSAGRNHRSAFMRPCGDRSAGFGLIELIVALMILSIGLLALTGAAAVAQRSFLGAQAMEEAANVAALVLDSLMREPAPVSGQRQDDHTRTHWLVHADSIAALIDLSVTVRDGGRERQLTFRASHHAK